MFYFHSATRSLDSQIQNFISLNIEAPIGIEVLNTVYEVQEGEKTSQGKPLYDPLENELSSSSQKLPFNGDFSLFLDCFMIIGDAPEKNLETFFSSKWSNSKSC